jgi:hypothetical protein
MCRSRETGIFLKGDVVDIFGNVVEIIQKVVDKIENPLIYFEMWSK